MLIGQLSRVTGFSKDTIRYYEKIALIVLPRKPRLPGSYKEYPEELADVLRAIRKYKDLGFTLEEIREILVRQSVRVLDVAKLLQLVELKIAGIDAEIDKLHECRLRLAREQQMLLRRNGARVVELPEMRLAA